LLYNVGIDALQASTSWLVSFDPFGRTYPLKARGYTVVESGQAIVVVQEKAGATGVHRTKCDAGAQLGGILVTATAITNQAA
jgi:hypothetical protein